MTKYPKIYLVIDNCYALKRWIRPSEWMAVSKEVGFNYIQASTDNEIDPLFSAPEYMDDWFDEVARCEKEMGARVINFYTGYQTYRTSGLAHPDKRYVENLKKNWIYNIIRRIGASNAEGLGYSYFAIPDDAMQDPEKYRQVSEQIYEHSYDIADFAHEHNVKVSVEQMYVPYQPPFTIKQSEEYLKKVYAKRNKPLYLTIDTGHMIGQSRFIKPTRQMILDSFAKDELEIWLGSDETIELWNSYKNSGRFEEGADEILANIEKYEYMFTEPEDADVYAWLRKLAKYSPIMHMQQTNGVKAGHVAFTPEANKDGIITGKRMLEAIKESYDSEDEIIPPVENIYLSFELFFANMDTKAKIIKHLKQTVEYWRQFVPEDGMPLDVLFNNLKG